MKILMIVIFSILTLSMGDPTFIPSSKSDEQIEKENKKIKKKEIRTNSPTRSCLDKKCKLSNKAIEYTKP